MSDNNFVKTAKKLTYTENGCKAFSTTESRLLDLFATIGALRDPNGKTSKTSITDKNKTRLEDMIAGSIEEDSNLLMKIVFYARDIRGGLGERSIFRYAISFLANSYTELLAKNIELIPYFGRWDDMFSLVGTPLEDEMWKVIKMNLEKDYNNMKANKEVSLLAKWLPNATSHVKETRTAGINAALKLDLSVYEYRVMCKELRRYIKVVEIYMSEKNWGGIDYKSVPSRCMFKHNKAFTLNRNDGSRFSSFLSKVEKGETGIKSSTLYPYDIVNQFLYNSPSIVEKKVLEAQWNGFENLMQREQNVLVLCDTSCSMRGIPVASSIGLSLYLSERNTGAFKDLFMIFASTPYYMNFSDSNLSLEQKIMETKRQGFKSNITNLEAAFDLVLETALTAKCPQNEIPRCILVISDMEINSCEHSGWNFYEGMSNKFRNNGYHIPNVIFWNVNSRNETFLTDNREGVQLVSGHSTATFKNLMRNIGLTPYEAMVDVLSNDRYSIVK